MNVGHLSPLSSAAQNDERQTASSVLDLEKKQAKPSSLPKSEATLDDNIVDFDGPDDSYRPTNWSTRKKITTTILYGFTTMGSTWASTIYNSGIPRVVEEFNVSSEVGLLGMTLFLFGFAFGPLLFAPLSEVYGRKSSTLPPIFLCTVFSFATATSKDIQTLLITRLFAGVFGSAPVSNVGGVFADIWKPEHRGAALVGYAIAIIVGPLLAPIVGGALVQKLHHVGWRWTEYLTGILLASVLFVDVLVLDESYPLVLLTRKADKIRQESKNWAIHAKHQEWNPRFKELSQRFLIVPFQMAVDPICFFMNLYSAFVCAIIYFIIPAFPIEFQEERGWNSVVGSLPFLAVLIGVLSGAALIVYSQKLYAKRLIANNNRVVPEARLPPMMIGSFFFSGGLFIIGWTSDKNIPWIGFCIGAVLIGFRFFTIFQSAINYLVDTFQMYAASALAANMFLRSILAGAFPLFSSAMFRNLGIGWGSSVLGFIAAAMIPFPILFYIFGKRIQGMGMRSVKSL